MSTVTLQAYLEKLDEHDAGFGDSGAISIHSRSRVGDSPLHWAAINGLDELARQMIDAGAEINALGESNFTPLDYAILHKHDLVERCLRQAGGIQNNAEQGGGADAEPAV